MNQYIYKLHLNRPELLTQGPSDEESEILQDHAAYIAKLTNENRVLLAGRTQTTDTDTFGIVIFCAASEDEAKALMANDPAVKNQVMNAKLFPYSISFLADEIHKHLVD